MNCASERNEFICASLPERLFVYDCTTFISCLCPPAVSQAVTIYSMSCEVISSSHFTAHAARDRRKIVQSNYFGYFLYIQF